MSFLFLQELSHSLGWLEFYLWHVGGFSLLYFTQASVALFCTKKIFPQLKWGKVIDSRPLKEKQVYKEVFNSFLSIQFLSCAAVLALKLEQEGYLMIHWSFPSLGIILLQVLLFFGWNELYFYTFHRLLHTKWLYRNVHVIHHKSLVTTPFTTLSFHWIEALFYSGTMLSIMIWFDFHIVAIMIWPAISMVTNCIGHYNYALFPKHSLKSLLSSSWRHGLHHARIKGNYGFWLPWLDQILGTRVQNVSFDELLESAEEGDAC